MSLEELVCSPEQSKEFARLGLFKNSIFVWTQYGYPMLGNGAGVIIGYSKGQPQLQERFALEVQTVFDEVEIIGPAPTMQEIGMFFREKVLSEKDQRIRSNLNNTLRYMDPFGSTAKEIAKKLIKMENASV